VVLAAAAQNGAALKYALGGLNQDSDCLKAAGLFEVEDTRDYERPEKATSSLKFSLGHESTTYATEFAQAMRSDPYLQHFKVFNPNTGSKPNCDDNLNYSSMDNPCRGTLETCKFPDCKNANLDGNGKMKPRETSCWRFAFRFHPTGEQGIKRIHDLGGGGDGPGRRTKD